MAYSGRQAGSVVTYVIVGVLLLAAAVGAIIVAQNRDSQDLTTRPDQTEKIAQKSDGDTSKDDKDASSKDKDADAARDAEAKKKAEQKAERERQEADRKAAEEKAAKEQAAAEEEARRAAEESAAAAPAPATESSDALPSTGPAQTTLGSIIGLLAIIGAGYGYYHFGQRR